MTEPQKMSVVVDGAEDEQSVKADVPDTHDPLFSIDGKWYGIPKIIPANTMFKYLRDLRKSGGETAGANMMYVVLGESTMDALADCDDMTQEDMMALMRIIQKRVMGVMQALSGN